MKSHSSLPVLIAAAIAFAGGFSSLSAQSDSLLPTREPDVIFVPTPDEVVAAMLKMVDVKPGEMVYDLGCGDGRIVISAARDFGARGIGVDIDPQRIAESRENATKAGVNDRVQFKQADLFTMNFADADVITLYLLPALNVRLRPRLLDELKPGTRIASHAFNMGDWEPDDRAEVGDPEKSIYFWRIPAKVAGQWKVRLPGGEEGTLTMQQQFQKVTGSLKIGNQTLPLAEAKLSGKHLTFSAGTGATRREGTAEFSGNKFSGTLQSGRAGSAGAWSGERTR